MQLVVGVDNRGRLRLVALTVQLHFQSGQGLEGNLHIEVGGVCAGGGLHDGGVAREPAAGLCTLYKVAWEEAEGEVESGCVEIVHALVAHEVRHRCEARYGHVIRLSVGNLHAANHRAHIRKHVAGNLRGGALVRVFGGDGERQCLAVRLRRNADFRVPCGFEGDGYTLPERVGSGNDQRLGVEAVGNLHALAFFRTDSLGIGLRLELLGRGTAAVALCHLFPVFRLAVEGLEVDAAVYLPRAQRRNGVAQRGLLRYGLRRARPVVGAAVRCVGAQCLKVRDTVERHIPRHGEYLLIGIGRAPLAQ